MRHTFILALSTLVAGGYSVTAVAQPPKPQPSQSQEAAISSQADASFQGDLSEENGVEFLSRGPLHEAFAAPYQTTGTASPTVSKQPPEAINELPPEYQPDGENVVWIPGYWAWDDDQNDFLWVSGLWRDVPPGQRWIPGYWTESEANQYQWIHGFWTEETSDSLSYLPEPPESQEHGPSTEAPDDSHFYIPGNWVYAENDYRWSPGYWAPAQQDWVWVPSQYVWTPRGYVYVDGYWDYSLNNRGVLFTPVQFQQSVYTRPNFTYRPRFVVDAGASLLANLFYRRNSQQYYFGNYYGSNYGNTFNPWVTYYGNSGRYDPLYTYYGRQQFNNQNAIAWLRDQNAYFASHADLRPATTVAAQRQFLQANAAGNLNAGGNINADVLRAATLVDELDYFVQQNQQNRKFRTIDIDEAKTLRQNMLSYDNQIVSQRRDFELKGRANANARAGGNSNGNANVNVNSNAAAQLQLPSFGKRSGNQSNGNRKSDWLTEEQIQSRAAARANLKSRQNLSDEAARKISEQGKSARQYLDNLRSEGRLRPEGENNWSNLSNLKSGFTPPNRPQGGKSINDLLQSQPPKANRGGGRGNGNGRQLNDLLNQGGGNRGSQGGGILGGGGKNRGGKGKRGGK